MSIISKCYSIYKALQTGNEVKSLHLLPKTKVVVKGGYLKININKIFTIGSNWTGLPFITTGLKIDKGGSLLVSNNFKIYSGTMVAIYEGATLKLGSGYINNYGDIHCFNNIEIGNNVIISSHVNIRDSDNHIISGQRSPVSAPIIIEDDVWIGMRAMILKGVIIGKGAVVAAGSIVTKSVPPHTLVAGNPARVIRENINWK